ncbi:hypothetical protein N7507_005621 [Penicillium longicatenatum]|nr:hypothetical protein N7507_005621 [Penicillium longicatenatum]
MTINHVFVWVSRSGMEPMRHFYRSALASLGYTEIICAYNETLIGYGSDYPYLWLKIVPEGKQFFPTHIAIDAPDNGAVDTFYNTVLRLGGKDNGGPGIRKEMSRQPYYSAFVYDPEGNNLEAVNVRR